MQERINEAKRKQRPDLKLQSWNRYQYASNTTVCAIPKEIGEITRLRCCDLPSAADFNKRFERSFSFPGAPFVIEGVPESANWKAAERWSLNELLRVYGDNQFQCDGANGREGCVKIVLRDFLGYMKQQEDDSPFYIFDPLGSDPSKKDDIASIDALKGLLEDYKPPAFIPRDLFQLLGANRPTFRWFLLGPRRSGSNVHIDPLATSAWNTLIQGQKRWVVFDPRIPEDIVKGSRHIAKRRRKKKRAGNEAVHWFTEVLPRVREDIAALRLDPPVVQFELVQRPGQTIFVPSHWWHAVLNLQDTVAITQNFATEQNFENIWLDMSVQKPRLSKLFLRKLESSDPALVAKAVAIDAEWEVRSELVDIANDMPPGRLELWQILSLRHSLAEAAEQGVEGGEEVNRIMRRIVTQRLVEASEMPQFDRRRCLCFRRKPPPLEELTVAHRLLLLVLALGFYCLVAMLTCAFAVGAFALASALVVANEALGTAAGG
jgi:histone arginine demethylase JMJD6